MERREGARALAKRPLAGLAKPAARLAKARARLAKRAAPPWRSIRGTHCWRAAPAPFLKVLYRQPSVARRYLDYNPRRRGGQAI